jgi:small subunit ribosomal protein S18
MTKNQKKKKHCYFCVNEIKEINYKDVDLMRRFISHYTAKIFSSKKSGVCSKHQKKLASAVKRSRFLALIPFVKQ